MEQRTLVKSGDKKADFAPNLTGVPVQRRLAPQTQDQTAFDNVRVRYSLNDANSQSQPAVIQRKQIVPLALRLKRFGADIGTESTDYENTNFQVLLEHYDAIENVSATRREQKRCLVRMLDVLKNIKSEQVRCAEGILMDELSFVTHQSYAPPSDPWAYMDNSPFIKMLQLLAKEENVQLPDKQLPDSQLPARQLIEFISKSHLKDLESGQLMTGQDKGKIDDSIKMLQQRVQDCIVKEGVLAHYSHREYLSLIHSTNYLKANGLLAENAKAPTDMSKLSEKDITTKSQDFDTEFLKNTGFVFTFLERRNVNHRGGRFGRHRYCVPLDSSYGKDLLNNGWAILHDLVSTPEPKDKKHELIYKVGRTIKPDVDLSPAEAQEKYTEMKTKISELKNFENNVALRDIVGLIQSMLATRWSNILFYKKDQKPSKYKKDQKPSKALESKLSGNYLMGADIIPGIAWRVALELHMLSQLNEPEYNQVISSDDNLWRYISMVVYDTQIMLPESVMPETYN